MMGSAPGQFSPCQNDKSTELEWLYTEMLEEFIIAAVLYLKQGSTHVQS